MSNSDFFKHLFLAAVQSGQVRATADPADVRRIMHALMERYLDSAQTVGSDNLGLRTRRSAATKDAVRRRVAGRDKAAGDPQRRAPRRAEVLP
ncbi:MAG: hypothetical protein ACLGI7_16935 [Gammaproteobacteria bacterium]